MRRYSLATIFAAVLLAASMPAMGISGTISAAPSRLNQGAGRALRFAPRQIREASKKLRYTIKARYPQVIGARNDPRLVKLNRDLKQFVVDQVAAFKKDAGPPDDPVPGAESTFDVRYQLESASGDLVSIGFVVNSYFEGAIHGQYEVVPFNYDLNSGRRLKLADLFLPDSNYLKAISDYCITALKKMDTLTPDDEWIKTGAGLDEKNYQTWNITRKGLEITFNPYQVASYAEGPQVVVVPYAVLRDVIDPKGPIARLAGIRSS